MTGPSAAELERLRARLASRDLDLLESLNDHRFLTTGQLARFHFARTLQGRVAVRACVRVLGRLREHGLVDRLARQVGGVRAGSAASVWYLKTSGERLIRLGSNRPYARTRHLPSLDYLAHLLAIAQVRLLVELDRAGTLDLLSVELEPTCWRPFIGAEGTNQTLKPDLSAVTASRDFEDHWFVEVDRGREGMAVLVRKSAQYTAYARTGQAQAETGVFPYVLWLLPSAERAARLQSELARTPGMDADLFRFATPADLSAVLTGSSPEPAGTTDLADSGRDPTGLARLLTGGAHERF